MRLLGMILVGIGMLLFTSCTSSPENLKVIPKETDFVTVFDVFSLTKKGKLYELQDLEFFKMMQKEFKNDKSEASQELKALMGNPLNLGIDFRKDVVGFLLNEGERNAIFCTAIELTSKEDFENLLRSVYKAMGANFEVTSEAKYSYIAFQREFAFAWDDNKAVFLSAMNYGARKSLEGQIKRIFELSGGDQITANKKFTEFYKNKKDVSLWLSSNIVEHMDNIDRMEKEVGFDINDNYLSAYLDFEDGEIILSTKMDLNKELQEKMNADKVLGDKLNKSLVNYFPKEEYVIASTSINPMAYYKMFSEREDLMKMDSEFQKEMGFTFKDIFEELGGSAVFTLSGFENYTYSYKSYYNDEMIERTVLSPQMGIAFDLNGTKVTEKIIEKLSQESEFEKENGYYKMNLRGDAPLYFAYNEELMYITSSKDGIEKFANGGYAANSLKSSEYASEMENNPVYMYANLNFSTYPETLQNDFTKYQRKDEKFVYDTWNSLMNSVEMEQNNTTSSKIILKLNDSENNSLNTIIKTIDKNYKKMLSF